MGFSMRLPRGRKLWALPALLLIFAAAGGYAFYRLAFYVNTDPSQCASCHPGVTALWKRSLAHPADKVSCFECHAAHVSSETPGENLFAHYRDRLVPEKYMSTPIRVDYHCVRCHKENLEATTEKKKFIKVNHKAHLAKLIIQEGREIRLDCTDCHANIAHDKAEEETNRPHMMGCFTGKCHQKERNRDFCEKCHYQKLEELEKNGIPPAAPVTAAK